MRVDPIIPRGEKCTLVIEAIGDESADESPVTFISHYGF